TATHRDLRAQIDAGAFREDLYYRLNVIQIRVPPLRDRGEGDVRQLLHFFLQQASQAHSLPLPTLTTDTEKLLLAYRWPGNVRELKNVTERLVVGNSVGAVTPDHLPPDVRAAETVLSGSPRSPQAAAAANSAPAIVPRASAVADVLAERLLKGE